MHSLICSLFLGPLMEMQARWVSPGPGGLMDAPPHGSVKGYRRGLPLITKILDAIEKLVGREDDR